MCRVNIILCKYFKSQCQLLFSLCFPGFCLASHFILSAKIWFSHADLVVSRVYRSTFCCIRLHPRNIILLLQFFLLQEVTLSTWNGMDLVLSCPKRPNTSRIKYRYHLLDYLFIMRSFNFVCRPCRTSFLPCRRAVGCKILYLKVGTLE